MLFGVAPECEAVDQSLVLLTANISLFPLRSAPWPGAGFPPTRSFEDGQLHAALGAGMSAMLDTEPATLSAACEDLGLAP